MSQTVQTPFGTGTVVDRENVRGRVSYKVEGPGFSTWIEATAMPLDFQWMPGPDDIQPNSVTLPYNPTPQTWQNRSDQNIVPGRQRIDPRQRTAPADSVDFQEDGESYEPGPHPRLFATGGLDPEDIQAKLGPKYVNAFVEHDFTSLQARLEEHPEIVFSEVRERVGELVAEADQEYLSRVGQNEYLEAADSQIREAAWKDVRAKAVRLRQSGQVNLRGATPDVIATQVTGDHGTYEVMVMRSNIFQGNSAVDSWTCECPWGQWAWKREHAFVGRMCSHAYASLMELQALTKAKQPNPKFRNHPAVWASRQASGIDGIEVGSEIYHRDYSDIYGTVVEDDGDAYLVEGGPGGEYWIDHQDARLASRTAEIVDLRPVGWDPYSRNLMNRLRDLTEEGSRPGRQKERNEEIRELVTELRERGFDTNGIMASRKQAGGQTALGGAVTVPDSLIVNAENDLGGGYGVLEGFFSNHPGWYWVAGDENDGVGAGWEAFDENNVGNAFSGRSSNVQEALDLLDAEIQKVGFINSPMGYDYIPDYGTSADYILEHEVQKREDVTEPEFEYPAGGNHGVVNDLNDGGGGRTSALSLPKGTQVQRLNLDGSPSGQTGVVSRDHQGLTEWDQVTVLWDGDSQPSLNDFSEIQWGEYEDGTPTKRLDDPWNVHGGRNLTSALRDAEDVVSALEANGWSWERMSDSDYSPTFRIVGRLGSEYITSFTFDQKGSPGSLIEAQVSTQDPLGWAAEGLGKTSDLNEALGWLSQYKTSAYEDDYHYGEPPAYGSGDEYGGDENPYYVDPAEQTDWDDPLPDSTTEEDVIANFQRNAGWLLGGTEGSGGHDDIAAAAEAHLRTAGRNFTMAEQQALIDEDDGQPYDRNNLRLRGTHYETGF